MPDSVMTPEGRLVNGSLFEKDTYKDEKGREAIPSYKIEMAFDDGDAISDIEDVIVATAVETWGERAEDMYENGDIRSPLLDGDAMAQKREKRGKPGDAYAGKVIIRAHTIYNKHGEDAPGGVYVADENAEELAFDKRGKVYNGSYGVAVVQASTFEIDGKKGVSLYLNGYQFVKDGEPLRGSGVAAMFQPLSKPDAGSEKKGRRRRSGK